MEALSERYGWLPSEILNQPAEVLRAYLDIASVKEKIIQSKYGGKRT